MLIVINFALIRKGVDRRPSCLVTRISFPRTENYLSRPCIPISRKEMDDYVSGWKQGSWDGLGDQFTMPYQWYFRTMEDWLQLLDEIRV